MALPLRGSRGFFAARFRLAYLMTHRHGSREMVVPLLALAATVSVAAGCWHSRAVAEAPAALPSAAKHEPATSPVVPSAAPSAGAEASFAFALYFPSREYAETGREGVDRLVAESITLKPGLATGGNDRLAAALLEALRRGPASAAALPAIPSRIRIRSVHVRDGIAELDLARAGLSGGSLEEQFFVDSIVRTLTQVPEVHAVRFLVDGKQTETLMGHVSTAQPIEASK